MIFMNETGDRIVSCNIIRFQLNRNRLFIFHYTWSWRKCKNDLHRI